MITDKWKVLRKWIVNTVISATLLAIEILLLIGSVSFRIEDHRIARELVKSQNDPTDQNKQLWKEKSSRIRWANNVGQLAIWVGLAVNSGVLLLWIKHLGGEEDEK